MCGEDTGPSVSESWRNLKQPLPLWLKARLMIENTLIKIRRGSSCCGHYGEPGC
jgi:hypothetical protein